MENGLSAGILYINTHMPARLFTAGVYTWVHVPGKFLGKIDASLEESPLSG